MIRATFFAAVVVSAAVHAALLLLPTRAGFTTSDRGEALEIAIEPSEPPAAPPEPLAADPPASSTANPPRTPSLKPDRRDTSVQPPSSPALTSDVSPATAMPHFTIAIGTASDAYGSVFPGASMLPQANASDAAPVPEEFVDSKARLLEGRAPTYPDEARANGVEGSVRLELIVGIQGEVQSASVIQGANPSLDEAALEAARSFRFDPAKKSGRRVRVRMRWSIDFRLE